MLSQAEEASHESYSLSTQTKSDLVQGENLTVTTSVPSQVRE